MFQSPLLRGNLRDKYVGGSNARLTGFSPLFFGATFATRGHAADAAESHRFSPLFFGATFATPVPLVSHTDLGVSVPSSSGQPSRQDRRAVIANAFRRFSPLFFGATFATRQRRCHAGS